MLVKWAIYWKRGKPIRILYIWYAFGVFVVAFYFKRIGGTAVFLAAIITESIILFLGVNKTIAYLWLNPIGCILVIVIAAAFSLVIPEKKLVAITK